MVSSSADRGRLARPSSAPPSGSSSSSRRASRRVVDPTRRLAAGGPGHQPHHPRRERHDLVPSGAGLRRLALLRRTVTRIEGDLPDSTLAAVAGAPWQTRRPPPREPGPDEAQVIGRRGWRPRTAAVNKCG